MFEDSIHIREAKVSPPHLKYKHVLKILQKVSLGKKDMNFLSILFFLEEEGDNAYA